MRSCLVFRILVAVLTVVGLLAGVSVESGEARAAEPKYLGLYGAFGIGGASGWLDLPVGFIGELGWGFGHLRLSAEFHHYGFMKNRQTLGMFGSAYLDVTSSLWGGKGWKWVPFVGVGLGQQWAEDLWEGYRRNYFAYHGTVGFSFPLREGDWSQWELVPRVRFVTGSWGEARLRGELLVRVWF